MSYEHDTESAANGAVKAVFANAPVMVSQSDCSVRDERPTGLTSTLNRVTGDTMQKMNLLVVERNADWSDWSSISRSFGSVLMLVQQADETSAQFHDRIMRRMSSVDCHTLDQVVMLRDRNIQRAEPLSAPLLERIDANTRRGLRVYPCAMQP